MYFVAMHAVVQYNNISTETELSEVDTDCVLSPAGLTTLRSLCIVISRSYCNHIILDSHKQASISYCLK